MPVGSPVDHDPIGEGGEVDRIGLQALGRHDRAPFRRKKLLVVGIFRRLRLFRLDRRLRLAAKFGLLVFAEKLKVRR